MDFSGETHTGSAELISPWHVMTTGGNLYDPVKKVWATNIQFHPGRNGDKLLHLPVLCVKKAVLSGWKQHGDEKSNMGILELSEPIGNLLGWNGLLAGDDELLRQLGPISVAGYPGDKPLGTMWSDIGSIEEIYESQFTHITSAYEGLNGAHPWIGIEPTEQLEQPKGYYSFGVHAYGCRTKMGNFQIATRLTKSRLKAISHCINELF